MNANLRFALPASLLVLGIFYLLCLDAAGSALLRQTSVDQQRLEHGLSWEMNEVDELIGDAPVGFVQWSIAESALVASSNVGSGYLSLSLDNRLLDASIFARLRVTIEVSRKARLAVFHRDRLDGPILSTRPVWLTGGKQVLDLDLRELDWHATEYDRDGDALGSSTPGRWGGDSGRIASLRIHPAIALNVDVRIDRIELLPIRTVGDRPLLARQALNTSSHPAPIVLLQRWPPRPDLLQRQVRDIQLQRPAASALLAGQTPPAASTEPVSHASAFPLPVAIVGVMVALAVLIRGRLTRSLAAAALAGLVVGATWLLLEPGLPGPADSQSSAIWFLMAGLMASVLVVALVRPSTGRSHEPTQLLGSMASWRAAGWIFAIAALPLLISIMIAPPDGLAPTRMSDRLISYLPWALVQQSMLCLLLARLTGKIDGDGRLAAATLFGLGHYPNFGLMVATFVLALVCLQHFRRYHALLPLSVLHALLGTLYLELGSPNLLLSGAIGQRFFG